jgi:hypothetical protein
MRRLTGFLLGLAAALFVLPGTAELGGPSVADIADAITELDVEHARALLAASGSDSAPIALERARLSLYVGDCDGASATLATLAKVKEAAPLAELAKSCARATAGAVIVEDAERGLWIRLQDAEDRALVPLLSEVAARARAAIERDLGVVMPRPLRIEVVRDLFSLSAVSGLPLTAAETTGTVAVARWGRVNLISPRAAPGGFPWEDTVAHEITHLAITRATRDAAPLWLQEGLAKREETRWRAPRPFDGDPAPDSVAREALLAGDSIGVDQIGPSIAMLPTADAASIAFAEVSSFVQYWIQVNGKAALQLLFADLEGLGRQDADAALRSVSGYDLSSWILRWQDYLKKLPKERDAAPGGTAGAAGATGKEEGDGMLRALEGNSVPTNARDRARKLRTGDLLFARGAPGLAAARFRGAFASDPSDPTVRARLGKSLIADGKADEAAPLFQSSRDLEMPHAGWFALQGRYRRAQGLPSATEAFDFAVALDPYLEDAACDGQFGLPDARGQRAPAPVPSEPERGALCVSARKIQRD